MAVFLQDSLDDTDLVTLTSHTGAIGATWTAHSFYGSGGFRFRNNGVYPFTAASIVYASGVPNVADYDITFDYHYLDNTIAVAVGGRISLTAPTLYYVYHNANEWVLVKSIAGALTTLGTYAQVLTPNTTYTVVLSLKNVAKKVFVNGAERISSTDNEITAAGRVGFRSPVASADNAGKQIRSITAVDTFVNGIDRTDADNIAVSETASVLRVAQTDDSAALLVTETRLGHRVQSTTDADNIIAAESRLLVSLIARTDADSISVAESRAIVSLLAKNESGNITVTESRSIVTAYPPVLNDDYTTLIKKRTDVLHRAMTRRFPNCEIVFIHNGVFSTTVTQTYALVINADGIPIQGFLTLDYWATQTISLVLLSNIYLYPTVLAMFGYSSDII